MPGDWVGGALAGALAAAVAVAGLGPAGPPGASAPSPSAAPAPEQVHSGAPGEPAGPVTGSRPAAQAPGASPHRTAWAYHLADLPPPALEAALGRLTARGVTRLFLSVEQGPRFLLDRPAGREAVARAVAAARAHGLEVHAMLLQHPRWLDDPGGAARRVAAAAAFGNRPGETPFTGLHLDVEPHTLDAWECGGPDGRARLVHRLADLALAARQAADRARQGAPGGPAAGRLPISLAIPWWLLPWTDGGLQAAARRLAGTADELVLMAYGEPGGPLVGGDPERLACRLGLPPLFDRLPDGTRLSVGLAGYEYPDAAAADTAADRLDARLAGIPAYAGVSLFLDGARPGAPLVVSIRGRVVAADGRPIAGARVIAVATRPAGGEPGTGGSGGSIGTGGVTGRAAASATARTNDCGRFVVRLPAPGAATLVAEATVRGAPQRAGLALSGLVAGREREAGTLVLAPAGERGHPGPSGGRQARSGAAGGLGSPGARRQEGTPDIPPDPARPPQAQPLAQARALALARRYRDAEAAYRAILSRWPGTLDARLGLARLAAWQGRREEAAAAYRAILADRCDAAEALLGLADLARWEGRPADAANLYAEVAADWPHEPAGFLGLGRIALDAGRPEAARGHLARALALDPSDADARELLRRLARPHSLR